MAADLTAKKALTFDVVGTLIDFESGLIETVQKIAGGPDAAPPPEAVLAAFAHAERRVGRDAPELTAYEPVLAAIYAHMAAELGLPKGPAETDAFAEQTAAWRPFPDSAPALQRLKARYRLVAFSNASRAGLAAMTAALDEPFDDVISAEDAGAAKPDPRAFAYLQGRLSAAGIGPDETLHVAQSQYHDIGAARAAGLDVAWIERRRGAVGSGATPSVAGHAIPHLHFSRLWSLADAVDAAFGDAAPEEPDWSAAPAPKSARRRKSRPPSQAPRVRRRRKSRPRKALR